MASPLDYTTGTNMAMRVLQNDFNTLPFWARGMIPPNEAHTLAAPLAKAVIDAVDYERAKLAAIKPKPAPAPAAPASDHSPVGVAKKAWGWIKGKVKV